MSTLDEKRVYSDREVPTSVYVAAEQGLVVARLSGDIVGEFSLAHRGPVRDVAADAGALAVATDESVLVAPDGDHDALRETGFGAAVAVGLVASGGRVGAESASPTLVAAASSGRVASLSLGAGVSAGSGAAADWALLGTVEDPRAVDGRLVAAADGVYRVGGDVLTHSGLTAVADVAAAGVPLAATDEALYELGNGWMVAREGGHAVVDADGRRAHAVADSGAVVRRIDGGWEPVTSPADERIVGFAYAADVVVAATGGGSLLVDAGDGWRSRSLGVTDVRAVTVP